MVKAIVFEKNGEINLATIVDERKEVCRENLMDFVPCPEWVLDFVPIEIAKFHGEMAPFYLYFNSEGNWELTTDHIPL